MEDRRVNQLAHVCSYSCLFGVVCCLGRRWWLVKQKPGWVGNCYQAARRGWPYVLKYRMCWQLLRKKPGGSGRMSGDAGALPKYDVKSDRHKVRLSSVEGFKQIEKISDM